MSKEYEYRAYAGACVDLANKATNDDDRKHLLAMAEAWLDLIDRAQRPADEPDSRSVASRAPGKTWECDVGFRRFTTRVSVIARAGVYWVFFKSEVAPEILSFSARRDPLRRRRSHGTRRSKSRLAQ
jgi:hypothetical protein